MVEYHCRTDALTPEMLGEGFFDGWPARPDRDEHIRILRGSAFVEVAVEDGRIVGFVTAISDGALSAYIPLLEVVPSHQRRGIGTELMRRLIERLEGMYMIDVSCDDGLVPFYERFGLRRLTAMGRRNYAAQSGGFGLRGSTEFEIVEAGPGAGEICADILAELPTWFGIPEANADYVAAADANETLVAYDDGRALGLITLVEQSRAAAEVHLMAVRPALHRRGIGGALLAAGEQRLRARGVRFLQVKTLSSRSPDEGYAKTRAFYKAEGFVELEEFPDLWDPSNPALQMIKAL